MDVHRHVFGHVATKFKTHKELLQNTKNQNMLFRLTIFNFASGTTTFHEMFLQKFYEQLNNAS